jgi:hypothetical protein
LACHKEDRGELGHAALALSNRLACLLGEGLAQADLRNGTSADTHYCPSGSHDPQSRQWYIAATAKSMGQYPTKSW